MHIHLPKALHGWREVAREMTIIIASVLIALFAEQLVQRWEWRQKVQAAEGAMRGELLGDDGPELYQRAAIHPCLLARLDAMRAAIEAGKSRRQLYALIDSYWVPFHTYETLAHDAANASDVASHMDVDEHDLFNQAYGMMPSVDRTNAIEVADVAKLSALRRSGGALSEAETSQLLLTLQALRDDERIMWAGVRFALPRVRELRQPLQPEVIMPLMQVARQHYGTCVRDLPASWPSGLPRDP